MRLIVVVVHFAGHSNARCVGSALSTGFLGGRAGASVLILQESLQ